MLVVMEMSQGLLLHGYSCIIHIKTLSSFLVLRGASCSISLYDPHIKDSIISDVPVSAAHTLRWTEGLAETPPLWLCPPLGDELGFAGPQNQHRDGHDHDGDQQQTQEAYKHGYFFF